MKKFKTYFSSLKNVMKRKPIIHSKKKRSGDYTNLVASTSRSQIQPHNIGMQNITMGKLRDQIDDAQSFISSRLNSREILLEHQTDQSERDRSSFRNPITNSRHDLNMTHEPVVSGF